MSELNMFQKWCKEILPIVQAAANGMDVQCQNLMGSMKWYTKSYPDLSGDCEYRIKPRTITVNGFEVPEPMQEAPEIGVEYWIAAPAFEDYCERVNWSASAYGKRYIDRGLCHSSRNSAIAHAKAMLGIDPNQPEE